MDINIYRVKTIYGADIFLFCFRNLKKHTQKTHAQADRQTDTHTHTQTHTHTHREREMGER